jgi:hypothetical protein
MIYNNHAVQNMLYEVGQDLNVLFQFTIFLISYIYVKDWILWIFNRNINKFNIAVFVCYVLLQFNQRVELASAILYTTYIINCLHAMIR